MGFLRRERAPETLPPEAEQAILDLMAMAILDEADVPPEQLELWRAFDESARVLTQAADEVLAEWAAQGVLPRPEQGRDLVSASGVRDPLMAQLVHYQLWTEWFRQSSDEDVQRLVGAAESLPPRTCLLDAILVAGDSELDRRGVPRTPRLVSEQIDRTRAFRRFLRGEGHADGTPSALEISLRGLIVLQTIDEVAADQRR